MKNKDKVKFQELLFNFVKDGYTIKIDDFINKTISIQIVKPNAIIYDDYGFIRIKYNEILCTHGELNVSRLSKRLVIEDIHFFESADEIGIDAEEIQHNKDLCKLIKFIVTKGFYLPKDEFIIELFDPNIPEMIKKTPEYKLLNLNNFDIKVKYNKHSGEIIFNITHEDIKDFDIVDIYDKDHPSTFEGLPYYYSASEEILDATNTFFGAEVLCSIEYLCDLVTKCKNIDKAIQIAIK